LKEVLLNEDSAEEVGQPLVFKSDGESHALSMRFWIKAASLPLALVMLVVAAVALFNHSPSAHHADLQQNVNLGSANPQHIADLAVVKACYAAWGAGKFVGVNARQELQKRFTQDCVSDTSADMKNTASFKVYKGISGLLEQNKNFERVRFNDFQMVFIWNGPGKVIVKHSYTPILTTTNNTGPKMSDTVVWTLKGGKISSSKFFWGNAAGFDALFDPHAPLVVVKRGFAAWTAGKFAGGNAALEVAKYFAEDVVVDVSADMNNTDLCKVYHGRAGVLEWNRQLAQMEFLTFVPVMIQGPGGVVFWYSNYKVKVIATGKTGPQMQDMASWTVKNGLITYTKFFYGNPGAMDKLFIK